MFAERSRFSREGQDLAEGRDGPTSGDLLGVGGWAAAQWYLRGAILYSDHLPGGRQLTLSYSLFSDSGSGDAAFILPHHEAH